MWIFLVDWQSHNLLSSSFPSQRPLMWNFNVFFVVSLNKLMNKWLMCLWFERPWHSCDINEMAFAMIRTDTDQMQMLLYIWYILRCHFTSPGYNELNTFVTIIHAFFLWWFQVELQCRPASDQVRAWYWPIQPDNWGHAGHWRGSLHNNLPRTG